MRALSSSALARPYKASRQAARTTRILGGRGWIEYRGPIQAERGRRARASVGTAGTRKAMMQRQPNCTQPDGSSRRELSEPVMEVDRLDGRIWTRMSTRCAQHERAVECFVTCSSLACAPRWRLQFCPHCCNICRAVTKLGT